MAGAVGLLSPREQHGAVRAYFGDSIRGTADFSYVSVGIGMVLGVIVGVVPIPIPGIGTLALGTAGGPLLVALLLGHLGRTGGLVWTIPASANLTLRSFSCSAIADLSIIIWPISTAFFSSRLEAI